MGCLSLDRLIAEKKVEVREPPIRSSSLDVLASCPRKFMWSSRLGLKRRGQYVPSLEVGTMVHAIIAGVLKGGDLEKVVADLKEKEHAALREHAAKGGLPTQLAVEVTARQQVDDRAKATMIASIFLTQYSCSILAPFDPISGLSEVPLEAETRYGLLRGRLDLVLQSKDQGEYWVTDFKTLDASRSTLDRAAQVRFEPQPWIYRHLLQAYLGPTARVAGCVHIIIQKPNLKFCRTDTAAGRAQNRDPFQSYLDRCRVNFYAKRFAAFAAGEKGACPPILVRTQSMAGQPDPEWLSARLEAYEMWSTVDVDSALFYPVHSSCFHFNRRCQFFDLCMSDPGAWGSEIAQKYVTSFREDEEDAELEPSLENSNDE